MVSLPTGAGKTSIALMLINEVPSCLPSGGLVFKAHRLLYHSTLGLRVMKKKNKKGKTRIALMLINEVLHRLLLFLLYYSRA